MYLKTVDITDTIGLSGIMKGQGFIGKLIKVVAVGVEKEEGGINVGS